MKLTYEIKIVLRPDKIKSNGQVPLYYSVRVGPTTTRLPTGRTIAIADWDKVNKKIKPNSDTGQLLLSYFSTKMAAWRKYMLQQITNEKPITITFAKRFFQENTKVDLFGFFQEQIDLWAESKEYNTLKSYRSTMNVLKAYNPKTNFGDLDYTFIQKFDLHMVKELGNGLGGRFTKHKNLKSIIRQAIMKGYMTMEQNPYRFFKIKAATGKRSFLSIAEVTQLMTFPISAKDEHLERTRDLFLFSCFTGLRYSDVVALKWENIKSKPDALGLSAKKTGKTLIIPITTNAKSLLDKYGKLTIKSPKANVFPYITNQAINRNLKDLMVAVDINKEISFHCARHTFASNHVEAKTNIVHLKDLLGHSKLTETQIYAKSLESDLFISMNRLQDMYHKAI